MSNSTLTRSNVLLVGQIYLDTILHVNDFPEQDTKIRANYAEYRTGGNTCNTAQVLTQFHHLNVCYLTAAGSHESCSNIVDTLKKEKNIENLEFLYRANKTVPSSTIIHNEKSGSRTIISNNNIDDIKLNEFQEIFNRINTSNQWWIHFEGRNVDETIRMIDWLNEKATHENWRQNLIISVECEKPDRENIQSLIPRGDVVFFSKLYAQYHGFHDAQSFLSSLNNLKRKAKAFCTWGSNGASLLMNETNQLHHSFTPHTVDRVVDTVGAGDTFNAGIIASLLLFSHVEKALQFACTLATNKVAQQGFENLSSSTPLSTSCD